VSRILLGVSGSIAAFKAAALASLLVQRSHEVRVILTPGGARFVKPLTFEAITANSVAHDLWDESPGSSRMGHIELARWADLLAVAPAGASAIARLALGLPTDLLGAAALSSPAPLLLAPAMESHMWAHPATQGHVRVLHERGATIVGPESGRLASGAIGAGRMAEPETIAIAIERLLTRRSSLAGKRVLVTAGPTYEPIDPVRFIGNRSSGKMGYAVAMEAQERGAEVVLISGPTALQPPPGVECIAVESTVEMRAAVLDRAALSDVLVFSAAVADFTPAARASRKLERSASVTLDLVPTSDIAAEAATAAPHAIRIGFALQTDDLHRKAREKLERKGLHLIIANELSDAHNPFGADENRVTLITRDGLHQLPLLPKREVAAAIWDAIEDLPAVR
jgi:phosphopantothenoylcysteine decarboxylase/phosphopantothenate--cysteine ligase